MTPIANRLRADNILDMNNAIKTVSEEIYSDGSGSCGVYEVYGIRFSGIHTGEKATVTPLGIGNGRMPGRTKGVIRSACAAIEKHLGAIQPRA